MKSKKTIIDELTLQLAQEKTKNEELISKYEGKITSEQNFDNFAKKCLEDYRRETETYKRSLDALLNENLNYAFLQQLINRAEPGVEMTVELASGAKLIIRRQVEKSRQTEYNTIYDIGGV